MTVFEVLSLIVAILGLIGGVVGFFRARAAGKKADAASKAAADALVRAAAAGESAAAALHRANEIAEAQMPRDRPSLAFERVSGNRWIVRNVGSATAYGMLVAPASDDLVGLIRPDEEEPRDVTVGDGLAFLVLGFMGSPDPRVKVTFGERVGDKIEPRESIVLMDA